MKVLVTGATGLIGELCVKALKNKYDVYGVYLHTKPDMDTSINWHCCDVLDIESITGLIKNVKPEMLLHLAWETEHGKYLTSHNNIDWAKASFYLTEAFYTNGGKRAVFAGTCFEYDLSYGVLKEGVTPLNPSSVYALSKKFAYDLISSYTRENQLSMAWGRIFYVYGGKENPERLVTYVINSLVNNQIAVSSSGEQVRDYLHVQDVANALSLLLENDYYGAVNICSNNTTKIRDIIYQIAGLIGKPELLKLDPSLDRPWEPKVVLGDNTILKSLGWNPNYTLAEGINQAVDSYMLNIKAIL